MLNAYLRLTSKTTHAMSRAWLRRLHRGPRRPGWPLMLEVFVDVVHEAFAGFDLSDPPRARQRFAGLTLLAPASYRDVQRRSTTLAGRPAQWFERPGQPGRGVVLYLHGGGYALGSADTAREITARLCYASGCRVVSLDYRLAPEHPFPAALDDAAAAYGALVEQGVAPTQIVLAGDSAGGGLAVATMLRLARQAAPLPAGAALISPWVDLSERAPAYDAGEPVDFLTPAALAVFAPLYLGGAAADEPLASPIFGDLVGLPPLLIQVGEVETLRGQIERFAERALSAGVDVQVEVGPEMVHAWHYLTIATPEAKAAIASMGAFARARRGELTRRR